MRLKPRALVVDDDRAWQGILSEILSDAGLVIDAAGSLGDALSLIQDHAHRMAVVDLSLQSDNPYNEDGLRLMEIIQSQDPACVSILLTGYATIELAVNAIKQYGAYTCLQKETFQRRQFREMIATALAAAPGSTTDLKARVEKPEKAAPSLSTENKSPFRSLSALVVEDDAGWREILNELLGDVGYQVRLCCSYGEALGSLRRGKFGLAVVDLSLGGSETWSGISADQDLEGYHLLENMRSYGIPTVVVSGLTTPSEIERTYREQGILAFHEKRTFDRSTFKQTILDVKAFSPQPCELDLLTEREREILGLLAQGKTNLEIAEQLTISVNTVKRHLKAIFQKFKIHTRSAAVALAGGLPGNRVR